MKKYYCLLLITLLYSCNYKKYQKSRDVAILVEQKCKEYSLNYKKINTAFFNKHINDEDYGYTWITKINDSIDSVIKIKKVLRLKEQDSIKKRNEYIADSIKKGEIAELKKWNSSAAGKIQKRHKNWSKDECIWVSEYRIWIGMHINMVLEMRGRPNKINTSNYGSGNNYQYCWYDYDIGYFYCGEDGIVTSYN